jgi:sensor histidine kinase regulating citrate/malate metabolism
VLECEDNGLGIDLNLHGTKIFGLYKTFHAHKDAHGVGLFLVKTQVESQGGIISVDSKLHVGTTFKIIF